MELNMSMVDLMTDPVKFREYMRKATEKHEQQKAAKRRWYIKHKQDILAKKKDKYHSTKTDAAGVKEA